MIKVEFENNADRIYQDLREKAQKFKIERSIIKAIDQKVEWIKYDKHYGNPVAKKLIPVEYIEKHRAENLFRVELPDFWRMLYVIKNDEEGEQYAVIIDILNHRLYNEKFGYD